MTSGQWAIITAVSAIIPSMISIIIAWHYR